MICPTKHSAAQQNRIEDFTHNTQLNDQQSNETVSCNIKALIASSLSFS
jgi:hypothetical protein